MWSMGEVQIGTQVPNVFGLQGQSRNPEVVADGMYWFAAAKTKGKDCTKKKQK
jgi:hypothetical protein